MAKADTELPRGAELVLQFVVTRIVVSEILIVQTQTSPVDRTQIVEDGRIDVKTKAEG